jgi:hypothetical protein
MRHDVAAVGRLNDTILSQLFVRHIPQLHRHGRRNHKFDVGRLKRPFLAQ